MLTLPDLDDRSFQQIVAASKRAIPKLSPQWTDENYHDPGITFIELFAWLAEMQQYYLNRVTVKNELKFLKLIGCRPNDTTSAKADVTFEGVGKDFPLPKGTRLDAAGQPFETTESILLIAARIEKIIVFSDSDAVDCTSSNNNKGVTYYAFGRDAKKGNRFYIGFDRELPLYQNLTMMIKLYQDYPVPRGGPEDGGAEIIPSARVSWQYYGSEGGKKDTVPGWLPLQVIKDETAHLSCDGTITYRVPTPMTPVTIHPANDQGRYWICCTVEEEGYELAPRLDRISVNTVKVIQRQTLSEIRSFSSSGQSGMAFEADGYLPLYGICQVQVRTEEGYWRYWQPAGNLSVMEGNDLCYELEKDFVEKKVILRFGDNKGGAVPPKGQDNIRLISYLPSFENKRFAGGSNGLPDQVLATFIFPLLASSFKLQVGEKMPQTDELIWRDWEITDDFDASAPGDCHYVLHPDTGEILFGNNENGMIPYKSDLNNICIISCQTGGGERGNVKEHEINAIVEQTDELRAISVTNYYRASGGAEKDSLDDAKRRARRELKKQHRAVTCRDFEEIAKATPGLRVAKVKAIPLFVKGLKNYPQNKAPAQMTVVVVPYSESKKPVPSRGFLETIRRHLDRYRLITTEVHVIPPEYIKLVVQAVVVVEPNKKISASKIVEALDRLFQPVDQANGAKGWQFGRTVSKGDIYGAINRVDGVDYIKDLWLDAHGAEIHKSPSGDIHIPPYGLVYSGEHRIEIVSRTDI